MTSSHSEGLPPESRNVLKVLHAPLDERRVGFVCISNLMFDAANANRMVKVFRSKATVEDLIILACGCAGISSEEQTATPKTTLMHTVEGICEGYLMMLEDTKFKKMFHYRGEANLKSGNLPTENLLEDTDRLLRPQKQPSSDLSVR